jgi:ribosome biogenesis SPOUT family RNA methylase Rps3
MEKFKFEVETIKEFEDYYEIKFKDDHTNRYTRWIDKKNGCLFLSQRDKEILNFSDEEFTNVCMYCFNNGIAFYCN